MVATWNPAAASGYYLRQSDYYMGGEEPAGIWYAPGKSFGLADGATVDRDEFERLFLGHDENGNSLLSKAGRRLDRTPAFDVTLSAPRSVSRARSCRASRAIRLPTPAFLALTPVLPSPS